MPKGRPGYLLDADKVREIRRLLAEGVGGPTIGKMFGVSSVMIHYIKHGKKWKNV